MLELMLNYLVSLSLPHHAAPVEELVSTLADEHEISRTVSTQVMSWFGVIKDDKWTIETSAVLKEIGLELLRSHKVAHRRSCPWSISYCA
jgi:sister chromatid cohesion protein DCC1